MQELRPAGSRIAALLQDLELAAEEALSSGGDRKAKVLAHAALQNPCLQPPSTTILASMAATL